MQLGVVIITHNGGLVLQNCVDSLQKQTEYIDRILVVISNTGAIDHPDVDVIHLQQNVGYSAAINAAFRCLSGPLLILNDDTVLAPNALKHLLQEYQPDRILQPEIRYLDQPEIIENTGHFLYFDGSNLAHSRGRQTRIGQDLRRMCFSGAAFVLPPEIREQVGDFDEDLSPFGEDLDYSLRALRLAYHIKVVPDAIIYHQLGGSFGRYSKEKVRRVERHRIQAKLRSMPWLCIALSPLSSIKRYWQSSRSAQLVPLDKRREAGWATILGIIDGYQQLPRSLQKRFQDTPKRSDVDFLLHWAHQWKS